MLWNILKVLAAICFFIYHRKVYRLTVENLPKEGPVLLAVNHPGAFLDACVISAYSPRPLYYLTRGDMFKKGIAAWFLRETHQIPIYRADHGISGLRNNQDSFEECYEHLADGDVLLIFPEAKAEVEKRLRPLYKGAARIVFGTYESKGVMPLIVPVGFTFTEPRYFGYDVFYKYGEPFTVEPHLDQYKKDPQLALQAVTDEIRKGLRAQMIYLEDDAREAVFNDAMVFIEIPPASFPPITNSRVEFEQQSAIAARLNEMSDEHIEKLQGDINEIMSILGRYKLSRDVYPHLADRREWALTYFMAAPFVLLGRILGFIPSQLTMRLFVSRVKRDPFIGPIKSMIGFFVHLFYLAILAVTFGIIFGWYGVLGVVVAAMIIHFRLVRFRKPGVMDWLRWVGMKKVDRQRLANLRQSLKEELL